MNVYGRVREGRLAGVVEKAGAAIMQQKCVPVVYRLAAGAERENATSFKSGSCVSQRLVAGAGFEPHKDPTGSSDSSLTQGRQNPDNSGHINELQLPLQRSFGQPSDTSGRLSDTSQHKKCAISVQQIDGLSAQLEVVKDAWFELSEKTRENIIYMVKSDENRGHGE